MHRLRPLHRRLRRHHGQARPARGLIAFETLANLAASEAAAKPLRPGPERLACGMAARKPPRFLRARTYFYAGVIGAVVAVMAGSYLLRDTLTLSVIRERAPFFVRLSDGGVRNAYALKLANKTREAGSLSLVLEGPSGLQLVVQNSASDAEGRPVLTTKPDGITQWRALVTAPAGLHLPESMPVTCRLIDPRGRTVETEASVFLGPKP